MPDDRRSATRTRLSGLHATYESADGVSQQADVFNLSRAGLFLETASQVPVGKRLSLEVHVTGEPAPWPALGRVIWTRPAYGGEGRPCGMGVKLIDVEDAVVEAIDRFVDLREKTEPGLGQEHEHEHLYASTILGVGAAPVRELAPATASEPLVTPLLAPLVPVPLASLRGDAAQVPSVPAIEEPSAPDLAIALVRRSEGAGPAVRAETRDDPSPLSESVRMRVAAPVVAPVPIVVEPAPQPGPRSRGRGWIVAGMVMIVIAAAAYALRGLLGLRS